MGNWVYALCGTAFFITFAVIVTTYGTGMATPWVAMSLLFGGLSQFFSQGQTTTSHKIAEASAIVGLLFSVVSLIVFVIDVTL